MNFFPIFVRLAGRGAVVVGGGEQALQKVRLLNKTRARVHVVAPAPCAELRALARSGVITLSRRNFRAADTDGAALVFAASGDGKVDKKVSADAQARNIPVNAVDQPALCTFYTPALVDRDPVVVAIGTEGTAPVLARRIKSKIESILPPNIGALAGFAQSLRAEVAQAIPPSRARGFWENFFSDTNAERIAKLITRGNFSTARRNARKLLTREASVTTKTGSVTVITALSDPEQLTLKAVRKLQQADVIIHGGGVDAILEYARRDATRVDAAGTDMRRALSRYAGSGCDVVCIVDAETVTTADAESALAHIGTVSTPAFATFAQRPPPPTTELRT